MPDAGSETVSLMMMFGKSAIPVATSLAKILLDFAREFLKGSGRLGKMGASKAADELKDRINGIGEHGHVKLKTIARQNRELMAIPVERADLKALKSQLKDYHVDFAVMEDALTGNISVHVKAQDFSRIQQALEGVVMSASKEASKEAPEAEQAKEASKEEPEETPEAEQAKEASKEAPEAEQAKDAPKETRPKEAPKKAFVKPDEIAWGTPEPSRRAEARNLTVPENEVSKARTDDGFELRASGSGSAEVIDPSGRVVWSAATVPGNVALSQELAEAGLEAYRDRDSLSLDGEDSPKKDSFEASLDRAEATAEREGASTPERARSAERERGAR